MCALKAILQKYNKIIEAEEMNLLKKKYTYTLENKFQDNLYIKKKKKTKGTHAHARISPLK